MTFLERAIDAGYAELIGDGPRQQVRYIASGSKAQRYSDPEEKVRAEYWAELILRYQYPPHRLAVELQVPDRKPFDFADIVIFRDDAKTRPFAVFECKPEDVSDAEFEQAVEQVCGNGTWSKLRAEYVGVVAGMTRRFLDFTPKYGVLEREANIVADVPRGYGKPEEFRFYKGDPQFDIRKVEKSELITTIRKCHQTLWGGGRLSPPAAFSELCKIIYVKIADETEPRKKGEPYEFQIKTHETSHRLAERIKGLYAAARVRSPDVLTEDIKIEDPTIRTVVSHLESLNLTATEPDVKGLAFEQFMGSFFKGDSGQYFTPREVVNFIVGMFPPNRDDRVIDPACGSGGFLLSSLNHIREKAKEYGPPGSRENEKYWEPFAEENLYGIEINDEIARVAKMNMILHGDGHTNVICADGLTSLERLRRQTGNKVTVHGMSGYFSVRVSRVGARGFPVRVPSVVRANDEIPFSWLLDLSR